MAYTYESAARDDEADQRRRAREEAIERDREWRKEFKRERRLAMLVVKSRMGKDGSTTAELVARAESDPDLARALHGACYGKVSVRRLGCVLRYSGARSQRGHGNLTRWFAR